MSLDTFNFEWYRIQPGQYPNGSNVQMGKGVEFGVKPLLPIQRTFILKFSGLLWLKNDGGTFDSSVQSTRNILKLLEFYEAKLCWQRFVLPHEIYGNLNVRFKDPFAPPDSIEGGSGLTQPFDMTVTEQFI